MIIAYSNSKSLSETNRSHIYSTLPDNTNIIVKFDDFEKLRCIRKDDGNLWVLIGKAVSTNTDMMAIDSLINALSNNRDIEEAAWGHYALICISLTDNKIILDRTVHSSVDIYYAIDDNYTILSDNLQELNSITGGGINEKVLPEFLLYRELLGPQTLMKNVLRLMPRQRLIIEGSKVVSSKIRRFGEKNEAVTEKELIETIQGCFTDYIQTDIDTFGNVTNSLSGGQDSSLTQNMALSIPGYSTRDVYSVSLRIDKFPERNEDDYAVTAANEFGCQPHPVPVSGADVKGLVDSAIINSGYPLSHFQSAWFGQMAEDIKKKYDYCYCSEGADSLFGTQYMLDLYRLETLSQNSIPAGAFKYLKKIPVLKNLYGLYELGKNINDQKSIHEVINQSGYITDYEGVARWYGRDVIDEITLQRRKIIAQYIPDGATLPTIFSIARTIAAVAPTVPKWNMIARTQGVNFLFPFANSKLFNLLITAPESLRLSLLKTKPIVKHLLGNRSRFLVKREKKSFGVPLNHFLFDDNFYGKRWDNMSILRYLPEHAHKEIATKKVNDHLMWAVMGLELWNDNFSQNAFEENGND